MAENLKGEKAVQKKLKKAAKVIPAEMGAALYQEALLIMAESMRRTPVEIGTLRDSHETSEPRWKGDTVQVDIQVDQQPLTPRSFMSASLPLAEIL